MHCSPTISIIVCVCSADLKDEGIDRIVATEATKGLKLLVSGCGVFEAGKGHKDAYFSPEYFDGGYFNARSVLKQPPEGNEVNGSYADGCGEAHRLMKVKIP